MALKDDFNATKVDITGGLIDAPLGTRSAQTVIASPLISKEAAYLGSYTVLDGKLIIAYLQGLLPSAMANDDVSYDFQREMTVGDFLLLRWGGQYEYITVGALDTGTTYAITRDSTSEDWGALDWPQNQPYIVLGQEGAGRLELSAEGGEPRLRIIAQGVTADAETTLGVLGELNGHYGISTSTIGLGLGVSNGTAAPTGAVLTVDSTNGMKIGTSGAEMTIDADGITFDAPASKADSSTIKWTSSGETYADMTCTVNSTSAQCSIYSYMTGTEGADIDLLSLSTLGTSSVDNKAAGLDGSITAKTQYVYGADASKYFTVLSGTTSVFKVMASGDVTATGKVTVTDTTEQMRLAYDSGNYTTFTVGSSGDITIAPSGGDLILTGKAQYSGDLTPARNATTYTGYITVPLPTPATSTSWDGDAKDNDNNGIIDLSSVFSLPAGIKGIYAKLSAKNTSVAGKYSSLGADSTNSYAIVVTPRDTTDSYFNDSGFVPCDSNGDIYFKTDAAHGAENTVSIQIYGYCI